MDGTATLTPTQETLQEACIIVPNRDRDGNGAGQFQEQFAARMVELFGGVTVTDATGYWRDGNGKTIRETVKLFTVAIPTSETARERFCGIAYYAGKELKQDEVYARLPAGNVELIKINPDHWRKTPLGVGPQSSPSKAIGL